MIKNKGQSAMEYLMTYGWAILVVMVVGIAMWQLGIFNMGGTSLTSTGFAKIKPQLAGTGYSADGVFTGTFTNGVGTRITINQVVIRDTNGDVICCGQGGVPLGGCQSTIADALIDPVGDGFTGSQLGSAAASVSAGENFRLVMGAGECDIPGASRGGVYNVGFEIHYDVTIGGQTVTHTDSGTIRGPFE
jgi:hypothetical protein